MLVGAPSSWRLAFSMTPLRTQAQQGFGNKIASHLARPASLPASPRPRVMAAHLSPGETARLEVGTVSQIGLAGTERGLPGSESPRPFPSETHSRRPPADRKHALPGDVRS